MKYKQPDWAVGQIERMSGLIEDECKHGVGHPNDEWLKAHPDKPEMGIHGCDGCCSFKPVEDEAIRIKVASIVEKEDGSADITLNVNNKALSIIVQDWMRKAFEEAITRDAILKEME